MQRQLSDTVTIVFPHPAQDINRERKGGREKRGMERGRKGEEKRQATGEKEEG